MSTPASLSPKPASTGTGRFSDPVQEPEEKVQNPARKVHLPVAAASPSPPAAVAPESNKITKHRHYGQ